MMMTTTTVMTRESRRRRRRQTVINDATAHKKTKRGVQTSKMRMKRTGRERGGGRGGGKTFPLPFCEEEERCEHCCRDLSRVVCVLWIESKRTKRKTKKIRERASERENTNQPTTSDAILYLFAKTSKFVPFLSRVSLSLASLSLSRVSLSLKNVWRETSF
jgi:hypothetical protein